MQKSVQAVFVSKQNFLNKLLEDLTAHHKFEALYQYFENPRQFLKNELMVITPFAVHEEKIQTNLFAQMKTLEGVAATIIEDLKKVKDPTFTQDKLPASLKKYCAITINKIEKDNFIKGFSQEVSICFKEFKLSTNFHYKILISELHISYQDVIESNLGCRECCPFCENPCTISGPHVDHSSSIHMYLGFGGWHDPKTKEIRLRYCKSKTNRNDKYCCSTTGKYETLDSYLENDHPDWKKDLLNLINFDYEHEQMAQKIWVNIEKRLFEKGRCKGLIDTTPKEWIEHWFDSEKGLKD